ncbi:MAG: hypothetical protein AVDCRST_MAG29-886 [uncultured Nocardioidaceae bacterium]|uniref:Secreted/membrane protein n=1 Tax=uncultured Nocardioidaceae bacterium TaxID=253824 RepID=A0A6J4LGU7_9ACTN|nr:MAG: hypothetical protein AVDCRST_MAG29-886 [uncultured Nocardioidaceae bacterium]
MHWEWIVVGSPLAVVAAAIAFPVLLVVRRRYLTRGGRVFELSVNEREGVSPRGWTLGLGRYCEDRLEWYRFFSWRVRPNRVFDRSSLVTGEQRIPHGPEAFALYGGHVVVECYDGETPVQLAMGEGSVTALMAWLESLPPGGTTGRVV